MVKKLWKHELLSYVRLLLPVYVAVLGVALLNRVLQFFETDSIVYRISFGSSLVLCGLAAIVAGVLTTVFIIVRFYRHLFSGEGYLTFTLPVTPIQHLWVKLSCAFTCQFTTLIVIALAAMVLGAGDVNAEVFQAAAYLFRMSYDEVGVHVVLFIAEFVLLLFASLVSETLVYYFCIAVGQTFKKNRVLAAVGVYFLYTIVVQVISTVISIVFTVGASFLPIDQWMEWIERNLCMFIHGFAGLVFAVSVGLSAVFFLLTRSILHKKLNLE